MLALLVSDVSCWRWEQVEAFAEALQGGQLDPAHYGLQADVRPLPSLPAAGAVAFAPVRCGQARC